MATASNENVIGHEDGSMIYHCEICDEIIDRGEYDENRGLCSLCAEQERQLGEELDERT
jgi:hypothetical protein